MQTMTQGRAWCSYEQMTESLQGIIYGNATSDACEITDCATGKGAYVSMRMRLACEVLAADGGDPAQHYEVCPASGA